MGAAMVEIGEEERLSRAADLVHALATRLFEASDVRSLYDGILDAAIAIMGADFGSLQALHADGPHAGELQLLAYRGFSPAAARFWEWVTLQSGSTCGEALRTSERVVVPDVGRCAFMAGSEDVAACEATGIRAVQTTPLRSRAGGAVIGMLSTHWRRPYEPGPRALRVFDLLARQAADMLDRQRAEEGLRASEERFRTVVENSRDGITMLDLASGRYVFMSPAAAAMTGFTAEELRSMTAEALSERVHPDDRGISVRQQREIAEGREPRRSVEYRWRVKSGAYRWFSDSRGVVRDGEGRPVALVGVSRDITERRETAERLRRGEARQAFLVRLADALRPLADPVAVQATATRMLGEHLGASRALYAECRDGWATVEADYCAGLPSLAGRRWLGDLGPKLVDECTTGRTVVVCDMETDPRLDGGARALHAAAGTRSGVAANLVKDGAWVAFLGVCQADRPRAWTPGEVRLVEEVAERTWAAVERARAERALRDSEAKYRSLFESIDEGFCIIEVIFEGDRAVDYRFVEGNPAFEQHTGLRDAIGRRMRELAPGHEEHWFRIYGEVARTGEPVRFENPAQALGRFYDVYAFRVGAPAERRVAVLFKDITDRKRTEEQLRAANARLVEADRRKSEFLAVLSHELRNPLAPIRNSIHLLERVGAASEEARHARRVLRRQTDHLARLVDDLLDVTRISMGKGAIHRERLDLRDVVRRTTDDLRSTVSGSGLELRVELPGEPVSVDGDAVRLAQVLSNLVQNAVKFTPAGGTVSVVLSAQGGQARLAVRDTGAGIEPAQLARMFEPFAQGVQDSARTKGGLGLGLALVKGLVGLHGGSVLALSDGPGQGTELVVTLPLVEAEPASDPAARRVRQGRSRLVLIVEDNVDAGGTLADVLELDGHRVRVALDARSGLALAREIRPEVIICDIGLPGVDGYAFARAARQDELLRQARLIALTGYAQPEDRARAAEAGFDAHLAKPPSLDELASLLRQD